MKIFASLPFALPAVLLASSVATTIALAADVVPGAKPGKGAPPAGVYNAEKISGGSFIGLGKLEIRGKTYRGFVEPGQGTFAPYTVDGGNNIVWSKGIEGMPTGWTILHSRWVGSNERGKPLIEIYYRSKSGNTDLIDCVLD